jgi:hypothetical protein
MNREVLYNILQEYGISMKLLKLITMCLNKTYSKSVKVNIHVMHFQFRMT